MYLIITEDNSAFKTEKITDSDKSACDDGYIQIFDVGSMSEYYMGEWTRILMWDVPPNSEVK